LHASSSTPSGCSKSEYITSNFLSAASTSAVSTPTGPSFGWSCLVIALLAKKARLQAPARVGSARSLFLWCREASDSVSGPGIQARYPLTPQLAVRDHRHKRVEQHLKPYQRLVLGTRRPHFGVRSLRCWCGEASDSGVERGSHPI